MSTFALDTNSSSSDIISGLNYAIANLGQGIAAATANVLVANTASGEITTTSTNSSGYTNTTIVSYLYQYMDVKYANSATGGSGFSSNSTNRSYYGLRNSANVTISSNPADYVWYQVTGGFGTTKGLYYQTIGGRQIAFYAGNTAPLSSFIAVPDMPNANSTPLNLDTITAAQNNQAVITNAYFQANTTPSTPSGGTYNFVTYTLTPPSGWSATIPTYVANTSVYVSTATFVGNTDNTAVPPNGTWSTPSVYTSQFTGNTGPAGQRGFVPMGYVLTDSNPTGASSSQFTTWFSSSRSNATPPIGLGFTPIANDTAQFAYTDPFTNQTTTVVEQYNGTSWNPVVGNVISGGLFVSGSINANTLNANQGYFITVQSTNANVSDNNSPGYWFQANTGNGRFGGNLSIGDSLIIGNNAIIGGNVTVGGLAYAGNLVANVVSTTNMVADAVTQSIYVADDPATNLISWTNGNTTIGGAGYLWPYNTRGFGVGGGATIIPVQDGQGTTGTNYGSKIQISYQAYVNSATNPAYNLIELWKSGSSSFYKNSFRRVMPVVPFTYGDNSSGYPTSTQGFMAVGQNGARFTWGYPTNPTGTSGSSSPPTQNFTWVDRSTGSGNFWADNPYITFGYETPNYDWYWDLTGYGPGQSGSNEYPQFTVYGMTGSYATSGATSGYSPTSNNAVGFMWQIFVGAGGNIARNYVGIQDLAGYYALTTESSGVYNDLYDVASDRFPTNSSPTSVVYVAVGTGGTILRNVRTYSTVTYPYTSGTPSIVSNTGWTQVTSGTSYNLNSVASNGTASATATLWCTVGQNGTILTSTNGTTWTARSSGTSNNLNGVAVSGTNIIAVGDNGIILQSTNSGASWSTISNPASSISRNLYDVTYPYTNTRIVAVGDEIIISSTDGGATWSDSTSADGYQGGTSLTSALTRLTYYGSWANIANVSMPPAQQQITNAQVVSGTYTDTYYTAGTPITYYLVLGNMYGNVNVYTGGPSLSVTEYKR